jgi:hypothetical protein
VQAAAAATAAATAAAMLYRPAGIDFFYIQISERSFHHNRNFLKSVDM